MKKQIYKLFFLLALLIFLALFVSQEARAAACANVPISGPYEITESCVFEGDINGVEEGDLIIKSGTLTINPIEGAEVGHTVIWNSGFAVRLQGGSIAIGKGNETSGGGQLRKAYIYMEDADSDGWPDNFTMTWGSTAEAPEGKIRRASTTAYYTGCTPAVTYVADMTCGPGRWLDGSTCTSTVAGYYSVACDNTQEYCTSGYWGTAGQTAATCSGQCAAGYYGADANRPHTTSACSGCCTAGYYCFAGSTSATQNECVICKTSNACAESSGDCYNLANNTVCNSCKFCQSGSCVFQYYDSRNDPTNIPTVQIGTQCWMKQSLNVGTEVSGATTQDGYSGTTCTDIEKYRYGTNTLTTNNPNYPDGALYQWNQAMCGSTSAGAQGICPTGWHIPTDPQLKTLVEGQATAGCESSTGWQCSPAGTNLKPNGTSGFEGNLAGYRATNGSFFGRGAGGYFWSSTQYDATNTWYRGLSSGNATVIRGWYSKAHGFSVRCLKD